MIPDSLVVIRDAVLSILGAATPAELSSAFSPSDWFNGNLARFGLLTPEPNYLERPAPKESYAPTDLAYRLRRLHERLPEPPQPDALGETKASEAWSLSADIWTVCRAYEQALRAMTAPNSSLDDRLRAIYGRLHVQAIKVAILLAALDWADDDGGLPRPKVSVAHWYHVQQIVKDWRASAHRLLADLGENEEGRWDISDDEDKQGMARNLFSYIVYDLDIQRIVDFRLKPWADRFVTLRASLYEDSEGNQNPSNSVQGVGTQVAPTGCWTRTFTFPQCRYPACA